MLINRTLQRPFVLNCVEWGTCVPRIYSGRPLHLLLQAVHTLLAGEWDCVLPAVKAAQSHALTSEIVDDDCDAHLLYQIVFVMILANLHFCTGSQPSNLVCFINAQLEKALWSQNSGAARCYSLQPCQRRCAGMLMCALGEFCCWMPALVLVLYVNNTQIYRQV